MARNSIVRPYLMRHLLRNRTFSPSMARSSSLYETLISSFPTQSPTVPSRTFSSFNPTVTSLNFFQSSSHLQHFGNFRTLCSSSSPAPSSGPSNVVSIKSEEEFSNLLSKVQDESLPAIFYFTAAWCGPCRLLSPKIDEWSKEYPHVTTYKIDIDQDGMENTLRKLDINAVKIYGISPSNMKVRYSELITVTDAAPTLLFFQNGKQDSQVVGANLGSLIDTMKRLYKCE